MVLGNENTLNIFVDASLTTLEDGTMVTCSGALAVVDATTANPKIIDRLFCINVNSTNNHGELMAILKGIELAIAHKHQFSKINIFSDSKISVYGIRDWCYKWFNNIEDPYKTIISSTGAPVSNQELIISIIRAIAFNNLSVSIYHQKGHVDIRNREKVINAMKTFNANNFFDNERNKIWTTYYQTITMSIFNSMVDSLSRQYLENLSASDLCNIYFNPFKYGMTQDLFSQYKSLINMKGGSKLC